MQQMEPPNATVAVRLMQEADLEAVAQLHISAFRAVEVGDGIELASFVRAYAGTLLLALARNPQLLGDRRVLAKLRAVTRAVVGVWFRRAAPSQTGAASEPSFGVLALAVAPHKHGSGVAAQLMHDLEGAAMAAGFRAMNLHVNTDNPRAIAFYEKRGWQREGAHPWTGNMRLPLEHRP